jgi:hypothetical protein
MPEGLNKPPAVNSQGQRVADVPSAQGQESYKGSVEGLTATGPKVEGVPAPLSPAVEGQEESPRFKGETNRVQGQSTSPRHPSITNK